MKRAGLAGGGLGATMAAGGPSAEQLAAMPPDAAFMHLARTCQARITTAVAALIIFAIQARRREGVETDRPAHHERGGRDGAKMRPQRRARLLSVLTTGLAGRSGATPAFGAGTPGRSVGPAAPGTGARGQGRGPRQAPAALAALAGGPLMVDAGVGGDQAVHQVVARPCADLEDRGEAAAVNAGVVDQRQGRLDRGRQDHPVGDPRLVVHLRPQDRPVGETGVRADLGLGVDGDPRWVRGGVLDRVAGARAGV